jgi:hypothetical protein
MSHALFLPPYLTQLGYGSIPSIIALADRAIFEGEEQIKECKTWKPWRGIFEYMCCVEYARYELHNLPQGRAIGSKDVVPARYNSASLVFFAQATLDNIAVWLSIQFNIPVKGSDCAFHKNKFRKALTELDQNYETILNRNLPYIFELEKFRQEWIHRLSGGASIFSDASPGDPNAKIEIRVPIEPSINMHGTSGKSYLRKVENCRRRNAGRWLYSIREFADLMADGCKSLMIDLLEQSLLMVEDSVEKA